MHRVRALVRVMRDDRLQDPDVHRIALRRLRKVLESAAAHVPFYQDMFERVGFRVDRDLTSPADLEALPVTTRAELKSHSSKQLLHQRRDPRKCHIENTSGSTGMPLNVYRSDWERSLEMAKWLRVLLANGYGLRDRVFTVTQPALIRPDTRSLLQRFGLLRRKVMTYDQSLGAIVDALLRFDPQVLYACVNRLVLLAIELRNRGQRPASLKFVVAVGEILQPGVRDFLRRVYGARIVESYGSVEMGTMAFERPGGRGLSLCEDAILFEFLDDQHRPVPPGVPGRVVVTDLHSTTMPFIRYDQGDRAVHELVATAQGPRRVITSIEGRMVDLVVLPDGSRTSDSFFYDVIGRHTEIIQYQVIQEAVDHFVIKVRSGRKPFSKVKDSLQADLKRWPHRASFSVVQVEAIDPDETGKIKPFISRLGISLEAAVQ